MTQLKVFVQEDGKGTFVCPDCGLARRIQAVHLLNAKKPIRVRCRCGKTFSVRFEIRKAYRKSVFLFGEYCRKGEEHKIPHDQMIVEDVSKTGLRFRTFLTHGLRQGDLVHVEFPLNDQPRSLIRGLAEVRWVDGKNVGARFVDLAPPHEKALGFFLMP
ncbi:PilZ domain-containing protein [Desulfacinum hydrothermale DSM 13146]|uniref:PilZ domain-containing protein n=1 Tax=Desulfacinum hydrothermale DSM 13146 TaxID=1121390 RepID=A0A1W1XBW5_9BACT|nr:PilZ domain-containing protein [Desulfacinum hydrothermale]SMC21535.1 PilZ domain-containing protein [Desulfacinum hydrothermale DSM 13146]